MRRLMNILIIYHIRIEFVSAGFFYVTCKRVCRQSRMYRKGAMPVFDIFHSGEETSISWNTIGNIAEGRKHLGEEMPVKVYRLYEYTIKAELSHRYGEKAAKNLFCNAGKSVGKAYASHLINQDLPFKEFFITLQELLRVHKTSILKVETFLTRREDVDCSRRSFAGETHRKYDKGFLSGILSAYKGKEYVVTKIDCWASGSYVCRFQARVNL